jgi:hypothetical protein
MNWLMRSIYPVWRLWALAWYRRALRECDPLHDDIPLIVLRINALERGM